jgi:hypothetical protein
LIQFHKILITDKLTKSGISTRYDLEQITKNDIRIEQSRNNDDYKTLTIEYRGKLSKVKFTSYKVSFEVLLSWLSLCL